MRAPNKLVGKIVELRLPDGFVYGLCTHDLKTSGQVVQLYRELYKDRLADPVAALEGAPLRMVVKLPLKYILKYPDVALVGERKLSGRERALPVFRSLGLAKPGAKPKGWWIIKGDDERWVDALKPEMAHYPDDGIYNLAAIEDLYVRDVFSHSPELLNRGPLTFVPSRLS